MNRTRRHVHRLAIAAVLCCGLPLGARAEGAILTLHNHSMPGGQNSIAVSKSDLESLAQRIIKTSNDYVDGVAEFRGPSVQDVISLIGRSSARQARMISTNRYEVEIELAELDRFGAILAMEMNGEPLTLRDKGPIWLMYPMDSYAELSDRGFNSRLVWQLEQIELF